MTKKGRPVNEASRLLAKKHWKGVSEEEQRAQNQRAEPRATSCSSASG